MVHPGARAEGAHGLDPARIPGTRVCVYGLSANPPTGEGGHATIVAHLRRMFDEVWVLPVYRHAFESKSNLAPYDHRVRRRTRVRARET